MGAFRLVDSASNVVSMNPDWDYKLESKKIENVHRTRSGAQSRYKWGEYARVKFKVSDLTSADACQINSWWGGNESLRLFDTSSTVVCSGYLVNANVPIGQFVKPYIDLFQGAIELEGY